MVVAGRLAWARRQIEQGTPAHISAGSAATRGRAKVKIVVQHGGVATSPIARTLLLDALDSVAWRAARVVAVDRGHRHSSTGASEINIWFSPAAAPCGPADHGGLSGPSNDGDGHDGSSGRGGGNRPRRGRSPPAGSDPWHGPNNVDPWASSSQTSPPNKAPRRHHGTNTGVKYSLRDPQTLSWATWRPSTPTTAAASSVTPEPPMVRTLPQPPLQTPRVFPPLRTGTPPLATPVQAVGSDGRFEITGVWTPADDSSFAVPAAAADADDADIIAKPAAHTVSDPEQIELLRLLRDAEAELITIDETLTSAECSLRVSGDVLRRPGAVPKELKRKQIEGSVKIEAERQSLLQRRSAVSDAILKTRACLNMPNG